MQAMNSQRFQSITTSIKIKIKVVYKLHILKTCLAFLKAWQNAKPQVSSVGHKDGFQVAWNFLESFQLSDFNEMQSKVTWDFT